MKSLKIILIDIESSPIKSYTWETYKTNVLKVLEPSMIISCAWKALGEDKTYCAALPDFKGYRPGVVDDDKLVRTVWKILDTADVVAGHNSDSFDLKKLNARFVAHGLNAPSDFKTIDTLKSAKKYFRFDRNSLDYLGEYLDVGQKLETGGFRLWTDCIAGKKDAWDRLKEYNKNDVLLLEKVYLRLRSYIGNHPNLNVLSNQDHISCSSCLSTNLQRRGFSYTQSGKKQRFQCTDCMSWSTGAWQRNKFEEEVVS